MKWDMRRFFLNGDVRKAWDYSKHSCLIKGPQAKIVENVLIAAIIREIRSRKTTITVDRGTKHRTCQTNQIWSTR